MSITRIFLIAISVTCLGTPLVLAQMQQKDPRNLTFGKNGKMLGFKAKSARQMMSKLEYDSYVNALAKQNCHDAHILLNKAFIREYPQFERARIKPNCTKDRDCRYWAHYARVNFKEYGHCEAVRRLQIAERKIHQIYVTPPKFRLNWWRERTIYNDRLIEGRDRSLAIMIGQAQSDYRPALIMLARLVKRGDVFNAGEETEYYILQRACNIGSDCNALSPRLAELRKVIAPERILVIEAKAREKPSLRPRLQLLLLGEKL